MEEPKGCLSWIHTVFSGPPGICFVMWSKKELWVQDFPGGPAVKTPRSQCRGPGSIRGQGTRTRLLQVKDPTCCN